MEALEAGMSNRLAGRHLHDQIVVEHYLDVTSKPDVATKVLVYSLKGV